MHHSPETFLDFVRPHWRRLHLLARQYGAGEEDGRDLVQETLLRAWRNFSPTEDRTYHRSWLFVILRNVALEWQRTTSRRVKLVLLPDGDLTDLAATDLTEPFCSFPAMDESRFREFLDEKVADALDALDAPFREVVVLSVVGGLTYREIAEVLDCPVGTIMSRMARARRALRERLADYAGQPRRSREGRP